ncbi:hypothetical protein M0805_004488 [Coniferiporia weirii]|nr:hypothetical protein M0805_004488 [Coniferiporia weirii]
MVACVRQYVAFIGFTILIWDHIVTLKEEVRYMWFGRKGPIVYLFFFIRYFTPLSFVVNIFGERAEFSGQRRSSNMLARCSVHVASEYRSKFLFSHVVFHAVYVYDLISNRSRCNKFAHYEGATVLIAIATTGVMMFIRVKALYPNRPGITSIPLAVLLLEISVNVWLLTRIKAVRHIPKIHACSMSFDPNLKFWPSLSAWLPLVYNTIIFVLTLWRCISSPIKSASRIVRVLMKDGIIYYCFILSTNLVLAIMLIVAREGVKDIAAQLTVAMMSRMTINLKREAVTGASDDDDGQEQDSYLYPRSIVDSSIDLDLLPGSEALGLFEGMSPTRGKRYSARRISKTARLSRQPDEVTLCAPRRTGSSRQETFELRVMTLPKQPCL